MNKFLIVLFFIFSFFEISSFFINFKKEDFSLTEGRKLYKVKGVSLDRILDKNFFIDIEKQFNDGLSLRIPFTKALNSFYFYFFKESRVKEVHIGRNNWFYFLSGTNLAIYHNLYSDEKINDFKEGIIRLQKFFKGKGKQVYFLFIPSKINMHSENVLLKKKKEGFFLREFELLLKKEDVNNISVLDDFSESNERLYFKRDSHWNDKGAYIAYLNLMKKIQEENDGFEIEKDFEVGRQNYNPDLVRMINIYGDWSESFSTYFNRRSIHQSRISNDGNFSYEKYTYDHSLNKKTVSLVRDSYGINLLKFLPSSFNVVKSYMSDDMRDCDFFRQQSLLDSDIIIFILVERGIVKFDAVRACFPGYDQGRP